MLAYKYRSERHFVKSIALAECIPFSYFSKYQANSDHTVEIKAQIANGELITVYSGTLIPPQ